MRSEISYVTKMAGCARDGAGLSCFPPATAHAQKECTPTVVGTLETFELPSKVFDFTRTVRVFLPPGYSDAANRERRYPVLYMFDGQNLFDACLAYDHIHEWQMDETVTRLVGENKIEPLIVVGLDNAKEKRAFEYLPWTDNLRNPGAAATAGDRLPEFLIKEVMPAIASKYRIAPGRENTGIGGSSYGGIAALYVEFAYPPSSAKCWPRARTCFRATERWCAGRPTWRWRRRKSTWLTAGKKGTGRKEMTPRCGMIRQVEANLKNALVSPSEVKIVLDPEAHHNEEAWAKRLPEAIRFLFPAR